MATRDVSPIEHIPSSAGSSTDPDPMLFGRTTQSLVFNYKIITVQRMLDFDYIVKRPTPSVVGLIKPGGSGFEKVFWGKKEILLPVYGSTEEGTEQHGNASVFVNFASARSAFTSTMEALRSPSIKVIAVIAEGVPERDVRTLIKASKLLGKTIIGPATVGGIQAGAFRIGDTAGTLENIIQCNLYRPGSVALTSKSGGMSNELYNVISRHTDGVFEGIAIGGDTFACTTLAETVLRFEKLPQVKIIVVLGELGGTDEYAICEHLKAGRITKPVCAWVSGTCAAMFKTEVQFGHAGARSGGSELATAEAKNAALKAAGAHVPQSFDSFGELIGQVFEATCGKREVSPRPVPGFPSSSEVSQRFFDLKTRKATQIISTISDDRGDEPKYCGVPISDLVESGANLGQVMSLLWFKKSLPDWATKFLELCVVLTADHGPCVSGAHNTIVASRAGKDLVSCVCSGLLTIGPRFGGAIDEAGRTWRMGFLNRITPFDLVELKKKEGVPISGIGHRVKSIRNPDRRVELLKKYAAAHFPNTEYLGYALDVEKVTTQKGPNLILNVDGCIGALFLDCVVNSKCFTEKEVDELLEIGALNGLFVLARTIGLIGHAHDQKRLKQNLYRHPWEDVMYADDDASS
jgi:ATP citrate (pro-S)-lyase